ncbi:YcxB family protein [Streptomyces sp. NPDC048297]|uniref:YcxB family protein n=1 Tax=Streptomyces sp. NPDC048297 TaxID=3365531 RepID=UPI0037104A84
MDMGRDMAQEQVQGLGQDVVTLEYRPVLKDYMAALRIRQRLSWAGRLQRWLPVLGVVLIAIKLVAMAGGEPLDWRFFLYIGVLIVLPLLQPWLIARQLLRLAGRNGTFRATVSDEGVSINHANGSGTVAWAGHARYRETPDLFVLYSGDKRASCLTVLPKRGLPTPAEADRLRPLLDRHLTRI